MRSSPGKRFWIRGVEIPSPLFYPHAREGKQWAILIENGKIARIEEETPSRKNEPEISGDSLWILPGVWDLHVHLRDLEEAYKEEICTGTLSAVGGGVTTVLTMANTQPTHDTPEITYLLKEKVAKEGYCRVLFAGSATKGLEGKELSPYFLLKNAHCVAISDDGKTIRSSRVMERVLEYAKTFDLPVLVHAEDPDLKGRGVIHEGKVATHLGLLGIPRESEELAIYRDCLLAKKTGARLHIQHISTKEGLKIVEQFRKEGVLLTCEVTPHHLFFTEEDLFSLGTKGKMAPPLREKEDQNYLREGLRKGSIDFLASDHAPHAPYEKDLPWELAPFGIVGVHTLFYGGALLVQKQVISWEDLFLLTMIRPRQFFRYHRPPLSPGEPADFFLYNPREKYIYSVNKDPTKGKHSPFDGWEFPGRVLMTFVDGVLRWDPEKMGEKIGLSIEAGVDPSPPFLWYSGKS
jgi:dihydroorotase